MRSSDTKHKQRLTDIKLLHYSPQFHLPPPILPVMCFSLFRSSKPKPKPKPKPEPNSNPNSQTNTTSQTNSHSHSSSVSSRTSLASLQTTLPQNPHIYPLTTLRLATSNFLLKPVSATSSSTSWSTLLDSHPSFITQRKLRRPISLPDLRLTLSLLCKSHHANLTKLRGATVSGNYIYLVYDFVQGASLRDCLRNPRNLGFTVLSSWLSRIKVAAGVADALDYMHNCVGVQLGFVHNHLKSTSVIVSDVGSDLNAGFVAKVCHFGTAQLCGEVPDTIHSGESDDCGVMPKRGGSVKVEGTRGYMAPEFQVTGVATLKTDVYAFGVVVLELLSGEEPIKVEIDKRSGVFKKVSLIEVAREAVGGGGGRLRQWVDRRLRDSYPVEVAEGLARVALECVQDDPGKRPDMGRVAGWISKLFLESTTWAQSMGFPEDFTVSLAPR